jgi:hypothetical protein
MLIIIETESKAVRTYVPLRLPGLQRTVLRSTPPLEYPLLRCVQALQHRHHAMLFCSLYLRYEMVRKYSTLL